MTYTTVEYDERTSGIHSQDTEMYEIKKKIDFEDEIKPKSYFSKELKNSK